MTENYIIIGSGIAALSAAKSIREIDASNEIIMISDEEYYPYWRRRLTKALATGMDENSLLLEKKEWYSANRIQLLLSTYAKSVDIESHEVMLSNGRSLHYSKLLLASGAKNFAPPIKGIDSEGVFSLRTLKDALDILEYSKKASRILLIGGGVLNLETAWAFTQLGKKVTIVETLPRIMPKQLDEKASEILLKAIQSYDIDVYLNKQITEIRRDSQGLEILTGDRTQLRCDMIIYSTGIRPNIGLIQNTKLKVNRGIVVNEQMETSIPKVYAAGDVAEFNGQTFGLWEIAANQGQIAGYNMVGRGISYTPSIPNTLMNAFHLALFSMGNINDSEADDKIIHQSDDNTYSKILLQNNRIIGAIIIGDSRSSSVFKRAIEERIDLTGLSLKELSLEQTISTLRELTNKK